MRRVWTIAVVIGTGILVYQSWWWIAAPMIALYDGPAPAGETPDQFIAKCWPMRLVRMSGITGQAGMASWGIMEFTTRLRLTLGILGVIIGGLLWRSLRDRTKSKV